MCSRLAVLVVVAAVLLWMCGLVLGKVARGIVVLPLRLYRSGYDREFVVAEMLSLREMACGNGSELEWVEVRRVWVVFLRLVSQRARLKDGESFELWRCTFGKTCPFLASPSHLLRPNNGI